MINYKALLDLAHVSPFKPIGSLCEFNMALMDGSAAKWRGMGKKNYILLCEIMDLPVPVWKGERMIKCPNDILRERYAGQIISNY